MTWFGVGADADHLEMFAIFALMSLAITGSTAGAVALFGPGGAVLGGRYFTVGTVISGASILPEFLPAFGRYLGENLPTGAGVQAVRDNLYFPAAPIGATPARAVPLRRARVPGRAGHEPFAEPRGPHQRGGSGAAGRHRGRRTARACGDSPGIS
jgi:hypothetical protein